MKNLFVSIVLMTGAALLVSPASVRAVEPFCPGGTAPDPKVIFCDDFESGSLNSWVNLFDPVSVAVNSNPAFVRSGQYSLKVHYGISADDDGNPVDPWHVDSNRFVFKGISQMDHIFIRGSVYHGRPANNSPVQRKLYYLKDPQGPQGTPAYNWAVVLGSFDYQMALSPVAPLDQHFLTEDREQDWNIFTFQPERWYRVEMEVKANSSAVDGNGKLIRDGYVKVWVDGVLVLFHDKMNLRSTMTTGINQIEVGRQADRVGPIEVNEDRYWDDILIAKDVLGTTAPPDDLVPPAKPQGLKVR
jgi:hypothetical protein